jgi:RHS repeat-associated protein
MGSIPVGTTNKSVWSLENEQYAPQSSMSNKIVYLLKTEKQAISSVVDVKDILKEKDNVDEYIESGCYASAIRSVVNTKSLSVPRLNGHLYQSGVRLERYNLSINQISTQSYEEFLLGQAVLVSPDFTDDLGTSGSGEVRRGKDGKMYVNLAGDQDLYVYNNPLSPNPTRTDIPFASGSMGGGGLPIQPHKERNVVEVHHRKLGNKFYELTVHLGNVRVVFSDYKIAEDTDSDGDIDAYSLDVRSWGDYYAFGMPMPGRTYNAQEYRFGFQGQEKDNEWTGTEGSHLAFKYRIHDARIGRFLSVDPLTAKYPHNSPYAFQENKLGLGVELEGAELMPLMAYFTYKQIKSKIDNAEIVMFLNADASVKLGVGVGGSAGKEYGIAYDKYGYTFYSGGHFMGAKMNKYENEGNVFGGLGSATAGGYVDWKASTFEESITNTEKIFTLNFSPVVGVAMQTRHGVFGLRGSLVPEVGFNTVNSQNIESYSFTSEDSEIIREKMSELKNGVTFNAVELEDGNYTLKLGEWNSDREIDTNIKLIVVGKDEDDNPIRFQSESYVNAQKDD